MECAVQGSVGETRQCVDVQMIEAGSGTRRVRDCVGGFAGSDEALDTECERMCDGSDDLGDDRAESAEGKKTVRIYMYIHMYLSGLGTVRLARLVE